MRSRFGVSKLNRRTLAEPAAAAAIDYEDVISAVHFALVVLKLKYPDLADDIRSITTITGPVIDRITEEL
jgi:hypothetical protein